MGAVCDRLAEARVLGDEVEEAGAGGKRGENADVVVDAFVSREERRSLPSGEYTAGCSECECALLWARFKLVELRLLPKDWASTE